MSRYDMKEEAASFFAINAHSVLSLLLWVLFGYVVSHIDCNIQHKLVHYPILGYVTMFICCYFLFVTPAYFGRLQDAVTEPEHKPQPQNVMTLLGRSVYVFVFMVIWLKCRWDFSFVVLIIMVLENFIKLHYLLQQQREEKDADASWIGHRIRDVSLVSNVLCFILLGIGLALKIRESIMMNKDKRLTANFFRLFVCR